MKKDTLKHADAFVVLMGSISDRILQAVDLYQSGFADKLLIVDGANDGYKELTARGADMISGAKQASNAAAALGIPSDSIFILPGAAQSTNQEAFIIRHYLVDKPGIDTLILVTSAPHTLRAYMIFKKEFRNSEKQVYIMCSPSSYTDFNPNRWWKSKDGIEMVLLEYLKLMDFMLFESKSS